MAAPTPRAPAIPAETVFAPLVGVALGEAAEVAGLVVVTLAGVDAGL